MPGLTLWKNQEIDRLRRDMDRLFARLWDDFGMPRFPRIARNIPAVAGTATNTAVLIPRAMVLVSAAKSFLAASALITGNIAVAREIPSTPSGN